MARTMITLICTYCEKSFDRPVAFATAKQHFCCREHYWAYDRRNYEIFWCSVTKSDDPNGCWLWQSAKDGFGYGHIEYKGGIYKAHRRAYELTYGPIPKEINGEAIVVRHTCDVPACVRPDHLILGTNQDNINDRVARGRGSRKLTDDQVRAIRSDPRMGKIIAREYGVYPGIISHIKNRKIWKHIP